MQLIPTKDLDRAEWLKIRQSGIGGSDIAAIMGMKSQITTRRSVSGTWVLPMSLPATLLCLSAVINTSNKLSILIKNCLTS